MRINRILFLALLIITAPALSCPTCVGRITKDSKPFFNDDFYTVHKSMDHLYQALNQTNEKKEEKPSTQQVANNSTTPHRVPINKESQ